MLKNIGCSLLLMSAPLLACTDGEGFLPPNKLSIPTTVKNSGLSKKQYDQVIQKVLKVYRPIARTYGGKIILDDAWGSEVVNAGTYRENGKEWRWHLNLHGGMARHPLMTPDGYASVVCHEIGHHIGGAPKKLKKGKPYWASTEGQSDYFATLKCLRKVFARDNNKEAIKDLMIPPEVKNECERSFTTKWEQDLCKRTSMAGLSISNVMANGRELPDTDFRTPDPTVVLETNPKHPVPQCRLDTYFQGSLCEVSSQRYVSQRNETRSTCHQKAGYKSGTRPLCWYKPKI